MMLVRPLSTVDNTRDYIYTLVYPTVDGHVV